MGSKVGPTDGVRPMDTPEMQVLTPNFPANPYFGSDVEAQAAERVDPTGPQSLLGYKFKRQRTINWSVRQLLLLFSSHLPLCLSVCRGQLHSTDGEDSLQLSEGDAPHTSVYAIIRHL